MTPSQPAAETDAVAGPEEQRPLRPALRRGWARRCPNCGTGPMLKGYLSVRASCPACGEDLHHHRADDGPAYLAILITGHLMAPALFLAFTLFRPDPLLLASIFTIGCVALSLYLLPRLKGLIVAVQWAKRMHGFAAPDAARAPE
jgi:uncharacterized protein (DUF983 family)